MSAIKTTVQLRDVSFVLRNLLRVGIPAEQMLKEAGNMLPEFKAQFHAGASQIASRGWTISQALESIFPVTVMPAIVAGEASGNVERVMDQVWRSAKTQIEIDQVTKKLRLPAILVGFGVIVSLAFYLFLIPFMYESMATSAPPNFDPGVMISSALVANKFVLANQEAVGITVLGILIGLGFLLTREAVKDWLVDRLIGVVLAVRPLGIAYSQLKYGIMAQYLQIVSLAGMDADNRIDLVLDTLPPPLRPALVAFRSEMLQKGLTIASEGNPNNPDDPRNSQILWPTYIRLAFAQANEGVWDVPMREFGAVMIEDGKEKLQNYITQLTSLATLVVGALVIVPMLLLYTTMGKVMAMSMQLL